MLERVFMVFCTADIPVAKLAKREFQDVGKY